jgi:hypothetical protein
MKDLFEKNYAELLHVNEELYKINDLLFDGKTVQAFETLSKLQAHLLKAMS